MGVGGRQQHQLGLIIQDVLGSWVGWLWWQVLVLEAGR